jgi:hypothetical protein
VEEAVTKKIAKRTFERFRSFFMVRLTEGQEIAYQNLPMISAL